MMLRSRVCANKVKTYGAQLNPLRRMNRHMVILSLSTWDEAMALATGLTNSTRNRQSPGINASCDWLPLESSHTIDFESGIEKTLDRDFRKSLARIPIDP